MFSSLVFSPLNILMWLLALGGLIGIASIIALRILLRQLMHESKLYEMGEHVELKVRRLPRSVFKVFRRWERDLEQHGYALLLHSHNRYKSEHDRPNCSTVYLSPDQTTTVALSYYTSPRILALGIAFPYLVRWTGKHELCLSAQTLTAESERIITAGMEAATGAPLPRGFRASLVGPVSSPGDILAKHQETRRVNADLHPIRTVSAEQYLRDQAEQHEILKNRSARLIKQTIEEALESCPVKIDVESLS